MNENANEKSSVNIIKIREDREPLRFSINDDAFMPVNNAQGVDWLNDGKFTKDTLRSRVEPWLSSLFQSEHLSLLVGSGLTSAIQYEACGRADNGMEGDEGFSVFGKEIENAATEHAKVSGRNQPNIEDMIRAGNEAIDGLAIIKDNQDYAMLSGPFEKLRNEIEGKLSTFAENIAHIEHSIAMANEKRRESAFNKLVQFLMSFASRTGTRDRLNIFTTNYDRLIEAGADVAGIRLIDRFVGAIFPVFRSSRLDVDMHYNPPGIRGEPRYLEGVVRFTKLHGSLDWINVGGDIRRIGLPFGAESIDSFLSAPGLNSEYSQLMIYPNSSKDRETTEYPYVELFRDFAAALCRPNSTLVTYGYSFGDDHINRVIYDMLTIPSTHLVIIAYDDDSGRIMDKYDKWGRQSQMTLFIGKDIAGIGDLVDYYLPKPSIDRASMRMAEILRHRVYQPNADNGQEEEHKK